MEKFAEVSPSRPTARRCSEAKKASGGKACQLRKTLTAEPGSAWRPERRGGARLSRVLRAIWQIPITAAQTAARSYFYASPALGVNVRFCRLASVLAQLT